jgi:hypothetical protein
VPKKAKFHFVRKGHRRVKKSGPAVPPTRVVIDFDDPNFPVDPDPVRISRRNHAHIHWEHNKGHPFIVCFKNDSPFDDFFFYPGKEDSGEVMQGAAYGKYPYAVEVDNLVLDPKVIIDP